MKVVLRRTTEQDLEQVALWYDQHRSRLGSEFMDSVRERLSGIEANPEAYPIVIRTSIERFFVDSRTGCSI